MPKNQVCLFFYVSGHFLVHGCSLEKAEPYGDFLVYPDSHMKVWDRCYANQYPVDFDYFPRGRVAYRKSDQTFLILYDRCIGNNIHAFAADHYSGKISLGHDEHYQCHTCNPDYSLV